MRLTQRVFSVSPEAQPLVGEMEIHSVANLATLQTHLAIFSLQQSAQTLFSFWESTGTAGTALSARARARAPLSLARSLSLSLSASRAEEQRFNSVKHRYYVASLFLQV